MDQSLGRPAAGVASAPGAGLGSAAGLASAAVRAAIFDLDRTLLPGPSAPILAEALRDAGLLERRPPGSGVLEMVYRVYGETAPAMVLARAGALATRGWSAEALAAAGRAAAEPLAAALAPYAPALLDEHRREGRLLLLATTTPEPLVAPLADLLGLDGVVATRYEVRDGRCTGRLAGSFVWGLGKRGAVATWARREGVSLRESFAYSDSFYDVPLLGAVGCPVATNPDPRLATVAIGRRWPLLWLDRPPGVPKLGPFEPYDLLQVIARPECFPYARFALDGVEHLPARGPAIVVANHRSYFDPAVLAILAARRGRKLRFLGKQEVFDAPVVGPLARALGGVRVERGSGSDRPLAEAARMLDAGELVAVLPQGTIPRGLAFFDPILRGRTGAARLAAMTGAPVIPIGLWGTEAVWPRASRLPRVSAVLHPPRVSARVGLPVTLDGRDVHEDTAVLMAAIVDLLPPEARRHRRPDAAAVAATMPPGAAPQGRAARDAARGSRAGGATRVRATPDAGSSDGATRRGRAPR